MLEDPLDNEDSDSDNEIADYFRSNLLAVRNALSPQLFKKFASMDDDAQRVAFVMMIQEAHELPLEVENNVGVKDVEKAKQLKEVGNKYFGSGEFRKALETYSNAILLAPEKDSGVILANRSATLYHLERFDYALDDAEEALRVGYPKELKYKLEERRAKCLLALKVNEDAVNAFRNALRALDDAKLSMDKKQKLEADIRVMLAVMEKGNQLNNNDKSDKRKPKTSAADTNSSWVKNIETRVPRLQDNNPLYPSLSNAIEIRDEGGDIGRHGIATRDIAPGEIVGVDKPHCSFLLPEYRLTHCHLCFTRIFVPMPAACNVCSNIAYCSRFCRNKDAKAHIVECELLPALWLSKTSITCFLALRAIIQKPYEELLSMKNCLKTSKGKFKVSTKRPYKWNDFEAFYGLVTHEDERLAEDIFHRAYMASWLLRLLMKSSYFPDDVKTADIAEEELSEGEAYIGGLILHNLQVLQFNTHEVSELLKPQKIEHFEKSKSMFIGGGVFQTMALLNHGCNPGIIRYFIGTTMIVRAIRTIAAGEEVCDNYGMIFTETPETERQRKLRLQYWFDCSCVACKEHWPLLEDIDPTILRFKCETGRSCGNVLPVRSDINEFVITCSKCGKNNALMKGLQALQVTDQIHSTADQHLREGRINEALKTYLEVLKTLDKTLALPIKDYHICQQAIRLCLLTLGNVFEV